MHVACSGQHACHHNISLFHLVVGTNGCHACQAGYVIISVNFQGLITRSVVHRADNGPIITIAYAYYRFWTCSWIVRRAFWWFASEHNSPLFRLWVWAGRQGSLFWRWCACSSCWLPRRRIAWLKPGRTASLWPGCATAAAQVSATSFQCQSYNLLADLVSSPDRDPK